MWKDDEEIVKTCLWSISYLSDGTDSIQSSIISTGCIPKILEYAKMKSRKLQAPSLRILGNLAAGDLKISEKLIDESVIKIIIDLIKSCDSSELLKEIMWILNNLSQSSIKVINSMIEDNNLNEILKSILEYGDDRVNKILFRVVIKCLLFTTTMQNSVI